MASIRNVQFMNEYVYHVYNRGVERRSIFTKKSEYERFSFLLDYYRHEEVKLSFSQYRTLPLDQRSLFQQKMTDSPCLVEIFAFCLMPNHFHLILKQKYEGGIMRFLSIVSNSYAKYFNTRENRIGPLFQGSFKAVRVETDEQLVHLSRYIHINPVVSAIVSREQLISYPWSSLPTYLGKATSSFVSPQFILEQFPSPHHYETFIFNQIEYAKNLERIKHLTIEEEV